MCVDFLNVNTNKKEMKWFECVNGVCEREEEEGWMVWEGRKVGGSSIEKKYEVGRTEGEQSR